MLPRRRAWLRIFGVRYSLPCDPSGWGSFMQWRIYHPSHRCTAGFQSPLCPLWVIFVGSACSRRSRLVRFAPKADMRSASPRNDDIHLEPDELGCDIDVTFATSFRPAVFDRDVLARDITGLAQRLKEGTHIARESVG